MGSAKSPTHSETSRLRARTHIGRAGLGIACAHEHHTQRIESQVE